MDVDTAAAPAEFRNGPDQILPATSIKTSDPAGVVQLYMTEEGPMSEQPFSIHTMMKKSTENYPKHPALAVKRDGVWKYWSYKDFFDESRTVAKAFIKLGLERFHGVCIMGFNSPEWVIANFGAIFAGGFSVGVYTTSSPEACRHLADNSRAQIIVVEDSNCLNKFLAVKRFLPDIKAIIQWMGAPDAPGVMSWAELLAVGLAEEDTLLDERLLLAAVNQCCTLIYTSGTTGPPKGVMCSQDHLTWGGAQYKSNLASIRIAQEVIVSYLPMSHLAAQLLDIYLAITIRATVYFAQPDALKGSLLHTLLEVQPTCFMGVPRVWEKIYEKMQEAGAGIGGVKRVVASWAKYHGLNYYTAFISGRPLSLYESMANSFAKMLIINKVKAALGLNCAHIFVSGAAPISKEILEYFLSLDIPIMECYGLSESMSFSSMSRLQPGDFKIGSVGKILPQTFARLDSFDECRQGGEICMKGRNIFMGYLQMPEKTNETIDDDGWLHTGDIGSYDEDGFLHITGRIKELVITAGGENIPPVLIEEAIKKKLPFISSAMLVGDRRKYLSILLTLKAETDEKTAEPLQTLTSLCQAIMKDIGLHIQTVGDALDEVDRNPQGALATAIHNGIKRYNQEHSLSNAQKVQRWALLPLDFSQATGELNNTLKLKRSFVMDKYKDIIDSLYNMPDSWRPSKL